ncbi:ferritin-like domain-containing protein [Polluticoccus soli]|uniref:ferritin-like domain-containing protein n=1 Tax=Polluticoccus soli TaxID=3034150 RepID=UPI0023E1A06D|nr:PA2169 family four-helix-bundle protein [Flavipsychrobacter sp. JY13-12]
MQNQENTVEILNDLVKVNNDRIAGYERAIREAKDLDVDLKATFEGMVRESEEYRQELEGKVHECGGEVERGTTTSGKIYRAWMDVKATFTGSDRKAILSSCEFGEDAALRAYESAMHAENELSPDVRSLISDQHSSLRTSHDLIKKYRDAQSAMDR